MSNGVDEAPERAFFLEEFRHRTLLVAVGGDAPPSKGRPALVQELIDNGSRVLLIAPARIAGTFGEPVVDGLHLEEPTVIDRLASLWIDLSDRGVAVVSTEDADGVEEVSRLAASLAVRLRAAKLILTDPAGGWGSPPRSFADAADLDVSSESPRPAVIAAVRAALDGGVQSVNLCRFEDLDQELFTFDGSGTLFTADAYLQVRPLSLDDLPVVEELVQRGVADGFLRPRPRSEVVRVALSGMGARVAHSGHLAGIGSLETVRYNSDQVGEIECLYTVNRFAGEGAGGQLLEAMMAAAIGSGLKAVFACTVSDKASVFFIRHGFVEVPHDQIPDAKWYGYDPERRGRIRALWLDLEAIP